MKKIILLLLSIGFFFIFYIGIYVENISASFVAIFTNQSQGEDNEEQGLCSYNPAEVIFGEEAENIRVQLIGKINDYLLNVALGMYQIDTSLSIEDIVDEINSWDGTKSIDENLQNYIYDHKYSAYLESIGEKHSLSNSRKYYNEKYEGDEKNIYAYYLKVLELTNDKCKVIVTSDKWTHPLENFIITQDFGVNSIAGGTHFGIDMVESYGATVYAVTNAVVDEAINLCPPNGGYLGNMCGIYGQGNHVRLLVDDGEATFYVVYMHLETVSVKDGDVVTAGQQIGTQGHSGNSTGSHLHLEFRKKKDPSSKLDDFINPHIYIDFYAKGEKNEI